jgi:ethanolamine utilization protein EutN
MLIVQPETPAGGSDGEPVIAFDRLGARRGDLVVITTDGRALQELLGPTTPGRYSVLGIPDRVSRNAGGESLP